MIKWQLVSSKRYRLGKNIYQTGQSAAHPISPVWALVMESIFNMAIFPSPISPVRPALEMTVMISSTLSSEVYILICKRAM